MTKDKDFRRFAHVPISPLLMTDSEPIEETCTGKRQMRRLGRLAGASVSVVRLCLSSSRSPSPVAVAGAAACSAAQGPLSYD